MALTRRGKTRATLTLYADKINQMAGLVKEVKTAVTDYKTELLTLKTKAISVNGSICDLQDVISSIQASSQTQEEKIESLETFKNNSEEFIADVVRTDNDVADVINQRKEEFYEEYYYLKPECEKDWKEKAKDWVASAVDWCKDNWKSIGKILVAVVIIVALGIATAFTGGLLGVILAGAFWGALSGALIGGLTSGLTSAMNGGSFLEGFADGALSGAITGAITGAAFAGLGAAGSALGTFLGGACKYAHCATKILKVIKCTSKVTTVLSTGMGAFDSLALVVGFFNPESPLVTLNQKLHSSTVYNVFQIGVSALAVFSGGAYLGMKERMKLPPTCFVAGTMILTATGLIAIENIKAGDRVISTDPDTFETAEKTVVETYIRKTTQLIHLTINSEEIITTWNHPFYVKGYGFIDAEKLQQGDIVVNVGGELYPVESILIEEAEQPETVYNFQVEDFHTYYVGNNHIWVHNVECKLHPDGEIEITDWKGYPENGPKPEGKLQIIDGDEYQQARNVANKENSAIHRNNPELKGKDIHEIQPIKFNGSPTERSNKIVLSRREHSRYTRFWNEVQRQVESQMK